MNEKKQRAFTFLMPEATRDRLKALAGLDRRSMTQEVIILIDAAYEARMTAEDNNQRGQWDES